MLEKILEELRAEFDKAGFKEGINYHIYTYQDEFMVRVPSYLLDEFVRIQETIKLRHKCEEGFNGKTVVG